MYKFSQLSNARQFVMNSINWAKWSIVLGCDGLFWVVTNREASRLIKNGYEMIEVLK